MKRQIMAAGISAALGTVGLVMLPSAEATPPCGEYQNPNGTTSTGGNKAGGAMLNVNNAGNTFGNMTSTGANALCSASVGSGNRLYVFNSEAPPAQAPESGDRCGVNQNNSATTKTGDNETDAKTNTNNAGNVFGNMTTAGSNLACDLDLGSRNTVVLFGKAPAPSSAPSSTDRVCIEQQGRFRDSFTGNNLVSSLFGLSNLNNIANVFGNMTSVGANALCMADIGSGNTVVVEEPPAHLLASIMASL